ncbi:unnamed protein product (macronuclear) [Paramecium tetraurelia]|uniref:Uncharacterized protein n=1 Tax=Paramecium tetraurelia TaxID=5888 RepID=A0D6Y3_PARTE|nr:uncharacterized protein GSPATT00001841001 [Paramecium tetraurelia]CAK78800.1 unnamed protein product [Paramecium tetraurelia]|eukprot:XP_001446197.1 hypothetical protein (macronuclear) [Paramecium tetraurelia strain d4-2]
MAHQLGVIQETYQDDLQELISKMECQNSIIDKRVPVLKKRRDLLLGALKDCREGETKLQDSKLSCSTALFSSIHDDTDQIQKLQDEIALKDQSIQELKDQVETLHQKLNRIQICNEEMQFELQKQQQQQQAFQRGNKLSQSMIVPNLTTSTEKAQATLNKFVSPITSNSFKSIDNKEPVSKEDMRKMMRRISQQASASAYILAAKGDYTTLAAAQEELQSQKSIGSQKSLSNK